MSSSPMPLDPVTHDPGPPDALIENRVSSDGFAILLVNHGIGGAEKRFAALFRHWSRQRGCPLQLIINQTLYDLLVAHDGLSAHPAIIVLEEPAWLRRAMTTAGTRPHARILTIVARLNLIARLRTLLGSGRDLRLIHGVLEGTRFLPLIRALRPDIALTCSVVASDLSFMDKPQMLRGIAVSGFADFLDQRIAAIYCERVPGHVPVAASPRSFLDYSRIPLPDPAAKQRRVIFCARLTPFKNPLMFLDMVDEVVTKVDPRRVEFQIIGDGELLPAVQTRVQRMRARGLNITAPGFVSKPLDILRTSLVFVQMMPGEIPASQAILEAMASGCAIVTTHFPGIETLLPQGTALTCELSPYAFATRVISLLDDEGRARALGLAASEYARAHFTVERFAEYLRAAQADARHKWSERRRPGVVGRLGTCAETVLP